MKQTENRFTAEDGNFIVRKSDGYIMGETIDLGTDDSIANYEEQPYTEESYKAFYESLGIKQKEEKPVMEETGKKGRKRAKK